MALDPPAPVSAGAGGAGRALVSGLRSQGKQQRGGGGAAGGLVVQLRLISGRPAAAAAEANSAAGGALKCVASARRAAGAPSVLGAGAGSAGASVGSPLRVRPASLEPGSPLARELAAGGSRRGSAAGGWGAQQQQQQGGGGSSSGSSGSALELSRLVLAAEEERLRREQALLSLTGGASPPPPPTRRGPSLCAGGASSGVGGASAGGGVDDDGGGEGPLQRQLFADVEAARRRQKAAFLRARLRRALAATRRVEVAAGGGGALVLHAVENATGGALTLQATWAAEPLASDAGAVGGSSSSTAAAAAAGAAAAAAAFSVEPVASAAELTALQAAAAAAAGAGTLPPPQQLAADCAAPVRLFDAAGRVTLAAGERLLVPLRLRCCGAPAAGSGGQWLPPRGPARLAVTFTAVAPGAAAAGGPAGGSSGAVVSILEIEATVARAAVDAALRFYAPAGELLAARLPLPPSLLSEAGGAGARRVAAVSCSDPEAAAALDATGRALLLRRAGGAAGSVTRFCVWLHGGEDGCDGNSGGCQYQAAAGAPLAAWRVEVEWLPRVGASATLGGGARITLPAGGGEDSRRGAAVAWEARSCAAPAGELRPAGGAALLFTPRAPGRRPLLAALVDAAGREAPRRALVEAEGRLPAVTHSVAAAAALSGGGCARAALRVSNPYARPRRFALALLPPPLRAAAWLEAGGVARRDAAEGGAVLALAAGGCADVAVVFDLSCWRPGALPGLCAGAESSCSGSGSCSGGGEGGGEVFVLARDEDGGGGGAVEECWRIALPAAAAAAGAAAPP